MHIQILVDQYTNTMDLIFRFKNSKFIQQIFHWEITFTENQYDIRNLMEQIYENFQRCLYLMSESDSYFFKNLTQNELFSEK